MSDSKEQKSYAVSISIPFPTEREVNIVQKTLLVDLKHETARMSSSIKKEVTVSKNELMIKFESASLKQIRVNANSILEFVILLIDIISNFDNYKCDENGWG